MSFEEIYICASDLVVEGGKGIRFPLTVGGDDGTGFVVRYQGKVHAYLNRCAHIPIELDWQEGDFFESSGLYLMCSTHGAIYVPNTGYCAGGPCRGGRLRVITATEKEQKIFWQPDDYLQPARA